MFYQMVIVLLQLVLVLNLGYLLLKACSDRQRVLLVLQAAYFFGQDILKLWAIYC